MQARSCKLGHACPADDPDAKKRWSDYVRVLFSGAPATLQGCSDQQDPLAAGCWLDGSSKGLTTALQEVCIAGPCAIRWSSVDASCLVQGTGCRQHVMQPG
jgi:hypothetical protein